MARSSSARAPQLLTVAALLLLLLLARSQCTAGAPLASELRCQCLHTLQGIHPKNIQSLKVTLPGPHCDQTEVIATLKNGQEVCLNPESPLVKKMIQKLLNKEATRNDLE
ncbi:growth-regulated protein homolog alpha-like [Thomomys bottae]